MRSAIHRLFALLLILLLVESVHCEEVSEKIPDFIPTEEYQEVLPGQKVPLGLSYKIDFETGKKYARLLREDEKNTNQNTAVLVSSTDLSKETKEEVKKEKKGFDEFEFKEKILLSIEDMPELENYTKYTEEERKKIIETVWNQRQEMLKEALEHAKTEMEQLMDEMVQLKNTTEINSTLLENIEYLLQDNDNAEFFHKMNGYQTLYEILQSITANNDTFYLHSDQENKEELITDVLQVLGTLFKYSKDTPITHQNHLHMIDLLMKNLNHYMELASSHLIELKDYDFIINKYFYILGSCLRNKIEITNSLDLQSIFSLLYQYLQHYSTLSVNKSILKAINLYYDLLITSQYQKKNIPESSILCSLYSDLFLLPSIHLNTQQSILDTFYFYYYYNHEDQCIQSLNQNESFSKTIDELFVQIAKNSMDEEDDTGYFKQLLNKMIYMFPSLKNHIKQI